MIRFADRDDAGRQLGTRLRDHPLDDPVVLGLPRGGVPVAAEVAASLDAPLDVLVVRKIGAPRNPEFAVGAIGEGGATFLDRDVMERLGLDEAQLQGTLADERAELSRRVTAYRGSAPAPELEGRTVLVVDDGMATGSSVKVAAEVLRSRRPERIVVAVPVASTSAIARVEPAVDEVVVLDAPPDFLAVGGYYDDFGQTTDAEVTERLAGARGPGGSGA